MRIGMQGARKRLRGKRDRIGQVQSQQSCMCLMLLNTRERPVMHGGTRGGKIRWYSYGFDVVEIE